MTTDQPAPQGSPADAYQEYFGPAIFEPLAEQVVGCAAPRAGDRVLDVACGTGIVTRRAAAHAGPDGQVTGMDLNPVMLDTARSIGNAGGAPIEYRRGDAAALGLPDGSFDIAYCQQGIQFVPDRGAAARELHRVLRDGGSAVVAVWRGLDHHPLYEALADAEAPHLAAAGLEIDRDDLVRPFSFGDPGALEDLLLDAGFASVETTPVSIEARFPDADRFVERMEHAYAAVVPAFVADPDAFADYLGSISGATEAAVREYRSGDHIVFPMHATVAVASA
jgi:SAM-dependent methyltransferase